MSNLTKKLDSTYLIVHKMLSLIKLIPLIQYKSILRLWYYLF